MPIAENITLTNQSGQSQKISGIGLGFDNPGDFTVNASVNTENGGTVKVVKVVHVTENGSLSDNDANTPIKTTLKATPITITVGQNAGIFDNIEVKSSGNQSVSGAKNGGGITFNTPGTYQLSFTVGNVQINREVTVKSK